MSYYQVDGPGPGRGQEWGLPPPRPCGGSPWVLGGCLARLSARFGTCLRPEVVLGPGAGLGTYARPGWAGPGLVGPCGPLFGALAARRPVPAPSQARGLSRCARPCRPLRGPGLRAGPPAGFGCAFGAPLAASGAPCLGASPAWPRPSLGGGFPPASPACGPGPPSVAAKCRPLRGRLRLGRGRGGPALPCGAPPALWSGSLAVALPPLRARPFRPFFGGPPLPSGAGPPLPPRACGPARPLRGRPSLLPPGGRARLRRAFSGPAPPACVASGAYQGRDFKAARKGTPFSLQRSVSS